MTPTPEAIQEDDEDLEVMGKEHMENGEPEPLWTLSERSLINCCDAFYSPGLRRVTAVHAPTARVSRSNATLRLLHLEAPLGQVCRRVSAAPCTSSNASSMGARSGGLLREWRSPYLLLFYL